MSKPSRCIQVMRGLSLISLLTASVARAGAPEDSRGLFEPKECYQQRNLVSDGGVPASHTDPNLVNGWGVAFSPFGGPVWVAANGTGVSTLYDGMGNLVPLVVTIPSTSGSGRGKPTGIVFNGSESFKVTQGAVTAASRFIFASEDGGISAWSPTVDPTHALLVVNNSAKHAIYKGLALAGAGTGLFLYATDFHNGRINVFDGEFKPATLPGSFSDPYLPSGYAPFGIQNLNGDLYVTYAKQAKDKVDNVNGKGLGFVNVFNPDGHLIRRVASHGRLNAPWGLALAPAGFGELANHLLVGNFGDGVINAYDPVTGEWAGRLRRPDGRLLRVDGLWGLAFGNGTLNQPTQTLFFAAGPAEEEHGLYGRIDAATCHDDSDPLRRRFDLDE